MCLIDVDEHLCGVFMHVQKLKDKKKLDIYGCFSEF